MIFMVVPFEVENENVIDTKLKEVGKSVYGGAAPNAWFVSYDGTTEELADKLGFGDDEKMGEGIIVPVNNYQGFASTSLWEWMKIYRGK